jgi:hypothetical protein
MKENAIKSMIRKLNIVELPKCEPDDMEFMNFNIDTYPVLIYYEYFNMNSKASAFDLANIVAKERWKNLDSATEERTPRCKKK